MDERRGFTLIELLVVLVVIGILCSITVPALLNALDRARQCRTMADVRMLGASIESYTVDNSSYPAGDATILTILVPEYMDHLITEDAWSHALIYDGTTMGYTLGSPGKEGGATLALTGGGGPTQSFTDDIIFRTGTFVQWPEGTQD